MAIGYSPRTVTDGLVFAFDTGNSKSYKGEPTTNLAPNADFTTSTHPDYAVVYDSSYSGGAAIKNSSGKKSQYVLTDSIPVVAGEVYTVTTRHYFSSDFNTGLRTAFCYELSTGVHHNLFGTVQGEWETKSYTFTITQNGNMRIAPYMSSTFTAGYVIIDWIQVEKKSHATPFTTGTRSVTESLFDQTKNTTLDLTNVSFDANAQMTFDGTNDYIDLGDLGLGAGPFTVEAVIYPPLASTYHVFFRKGDDSNSNDNMDWSMGYDYNQFHVRAANASTTVNEYAGGSFVNSNGYVVLTYNGNTIRMYRNGTEVLNKAVTFANNYSNYSIGRGINKYAQLDVKNVKVYSRALSADEVQQNYNALKGRFGL